MRIHPSTVLAVVWLASSQGGAGAFHVPSRFSATSNRAVIPRMSMVEESVSSSDISVPYDAAARLAYDEWRTKYGKGAFDPVRYQAFKANYETITVANVVAKKKARETGTELPALMTLNEFGDCTEDEYAAAQMQTQKPTTSTDSVLGKALEAAVSQSEASSALEDAANALAEEEEVSFASFVFSRPPVRHSFIHACHSLLLLLETCQTIGIGECGRVGGSFRFTLWDCC